MAKPGSRNQCRGYENSQYTHRNSSPPCTLNGLAGRQPYNSSAEIEPATVEAGELGGPVIRTSNENGRRVYAATYNGRIVLSGDFDAVQSQVKVWQAEHDLMISQRRKAAGFE